MFYIFKALNSILIIRFSAIGDIVLTSAIVRCVRAKYPNAKIHFLVKKKFRGAIESNKYINKCISFVDHPLEIIEDLKIENYDFVVDLQRNAKSLFVRRKLKCNSATFPKLNIQKFLLTKLKINKLPKIHVVDRYFLAVKKLDVYNDNQGLDFFITDENKLFDKDQLSQLHGNFIALVLGATYFTKRIPHEKLEEIIEGIKSTVILLGGKDENELGERLSKKYSNVINIAGKTSLQQSAHYLKNASSVITSDTGLMHIAAAFQKRIITIWGNTVPDFGMYAYMPNKLENNIMLEVNNLNCRPCSKLGHTKCPKKHFKCMINQDASKIASLAEQRF